MFISTACALLLIAADTPATSPTTRPSMTYLDGVDAEIAAADPDIAAHRAAASTMKADREKSWDATREVSAAIADRGSKLAALEAIRSSGTPEQRLTASQAFTRADRELKRLRALSLPGEDEAKELAAIDEGLRRIESLRTARQKFLDDQAAADEAAKPKPKAYTSIERGMTEDEVFSFLGKGWYYGRQSETVDAKVVEFYQGGQSVPGFPGERHEKTVYTCYFDKKSGRLINYVKQAQ